MQLDSATTNQSMLVISQNCFHGVDSFISYLQQWCIQLFPIFLGQHAAHTFHLAISIVVVHSHERNVYMVNQKHHHWLC